MRGGPPRSRSTDTLFPYTTLGRARRAAGAVLVDRAHAHGHVDQPKLFVGRRSAPTVGGSPAIVLARFQRGRVLRIARIEVPHQPRSEEHTSELQSLIRISYAVYFLKTNKQDNLQS